MTEFTLAAYKNTGLNGHPVYAIKADGVLVGELHWDQRWKSAGGNAWAAKVFGSLATSVTYSKDKTKVLEQFKDLFEDVKRREGLHPDPESKALRHPGVYQNGKLLNP